MGGELRFRRVGKAYTAGSDGLRFWLSRNAGHTWTLALRYKNPLGESEWQHIGRFPTIAAGAEAANALVQEVTA